MLLICLRWIWLLFLKSIVFDKADLSMQKLLHVVKRQGAVEVLEEEG